jgi:hypothetical protein
MDLVEAQARGLDEPARHPWERARVALALEIVRNMAPIAPGDVVLDIGCGDTYVVEQFARAYPASTFYAVDRAFTPALMGTFRSRLTVPNVQLFASLDAVPDDRPARLVLLMDVIEHVRDDVAMLRDICARPVIGRGCRFLITVPSYQSLFSAHDTFLGHYRRYSLATLRGTIRAAGLAPVMDGYLVGSLLPLRFVLVVRERLRGARESGATDLATWNGSEAAGRLLSAVLVAEGRVALTLARAGVRLPGLSNVAVCKTSV